MYLLLQQPAGVGGLIKLLRFDAVDAVVRMLWLVFMQPLKGRFLKGRLGIAVKCSEGQAKDPCSFNSEDRLAPEAWSATAEGQNSGRSQRSLADSTWFNYRSRYCNILLWDGFPNGEVWRLQTWKHFNPFNHNMLDVAWHCVKASMAPSSVSSAARPLPVAILYQKKGREIKTDAKVRQVTKTNQDLDILAVSPSMMKP